MEKGDRFIFYFKINLSPFLFLTVIILSILLLIPNIETYAANLSMNMGKDSTSVAVGRDFNFGYAMLGISATFTTDEPWSYVSTSESLNKSCMDFQSDPTKDCEPKGRFHDGDEWEVFGKLGYRLPLISIIYINTGIGISRQRIAELYIFCVGIDEPGGGCSKARLFETWGKVSEHYYLNFLGGFTFKMTHHLLFTVDYHTRKGILGGFMWRF